MERGSDQRRGGMLNKGWSPGPVEFIFICYLHGKGSGMKLTENYNNNKKKPIKKKKKGTVPRIFLPPLCPHSGKSSGVYSIPDTIIMNLSLLYGEWNESRNMLRIHVFMRF